MWELLEGTKENSVLPLMRGDSFQAKQKQSLVTQPGVAELFVIIGPAPKTGLSALFPACYPSRLRSW